MKKNNSFLTTLCVVIFGLFASGIGCGGGGGGGGGSSTGGGSGDSGSGDSGGGDSGGGVIELSATDIQLRDHLFVLDNGVTIRFTYPNAGVVPTPDVTDSVSGDTLDVFYADVSNNQRYQISSIGTNPLYHYELNVTWTSTTTGTLTGTYDIDIIDGIPPVAVTGNLTVAE